MAVETETQAGRCATHGTVQATRDIPKMGFPFIYYALVRSRAKRKPFLCPECGEAVQADWTVRPRMFQVADSGGWDTWGRADGQVAVSSPDGASFLLVTEPGGFEAFMRTRAEPAQSLTLPPSPSSPPTPHSSPPTPPNTAST